MKTLRQLLLFVSAIALLAPVPAGAGPVGEGVTSLSLSPEVLRDLGVALIAPTPSATPLRDGALGFRVVSGTMTWNGGPGDFEGFSGLSLVHEGGFQLGIAGGTYDLTPLRIERAAPPHELSLVDAAGRVWLETGAMQGFIEATGDAVRFDNADVIVGPELAAQLGRPELEGSWLGVMDARYRLAPSGSASAGAMAAGAQGASCVGDFVSPSDVALITLGYMSQGAREPGGRVALAPRAVLRNHGPGDVEWYRAIAPDSPNGPHPFLALAFYRLQDGVLEQIGRADAKHAFYAVNSNCACPGGNVLYAGCEDAYGVSTNLDRHHLGPRSEIDALPRSWTSLGSHFDGTPVNDYRDHEASAHDDFEHRLVVLESEISDPSARYFYEAWYMAPRDSNLDNSMGHRETAPLLSGSVWTFPTVDTGFTDGILLDLVVDPQSPAPGSESHRLDTGQGRLQVTVSTEDQGGGDTRYVYHLMNFDFDRQVETFRVPLLPGLNVTALAFSDSDDDAGNDWTAQVTSDAVVWTAPVGNALDWGGLYSFRMNVDAAPVASRVTLGALEPGGPVSYPVDMLAPANPTIAPVPALSPRGFWLAGFALIAAFAWHLARRRARASAGGAAPLRS